ncbi:Uma2 family endonuclease [Chlorogloeopsis fritschii PCC 9212]|uniref:Putative restriction endonuclease domain-containing protein n=1 Tax=Chlorogloeopsis fritschii PCC 6912 TaxID=211165 RepID=A0A3S0XR86_CHLFR|nr:Uma2 family endonuclease [Chlorogloeopsis fritschii]MBF2008616.1 Uma2 family endonuclease [Chlorogloeopsis fritschii C42_A2020_084]RUR78741.1 hypothetical protein PCC6912_35060 [Chlorogloeopsis fritschii PCC 6912]
MTSPILNLRPAIELKDEQFFQLCQHNQDLHLERTAEGELIIMPPTGWESRNRNARLTQRLGNWAESREDVLPGFLLDLAGILS